MRNRLQNTISTDIIIINNVYSYRLKDSYLLWILLALYYGIIINSRPIARKFSWAVLLKKSGPFDTVHVSQSQEQFKNL